MVSSTAILSVSQSVWTSVALTYCVEMAKHIKHFYSASSPVILHTHYNGTVLMRVIFVGH